GGGEEMEVVTVGWRRWRVEESGVGDRVDPLRRTTFGVRRKNPPENFSGGGVVMAGASDIQHSAAYSDLRVLKIGIRASRGGFYGESDDEEISGGRHFQGSFVLGTEEQPYSPPIDSPTTESPGYVTESDPEEDPEGYEDDETEDGPVDYPMDGGDDGDDDDGDSSRDDANDEDEDEEDEEDEEEEHLAPADSTTVIPAVIPPPSTDITVGARITVRPQASISLPPEAEVERLLTMTTPSPSPPISLSPPSAGERLARCTAPPAHSPPLPPSSGDDIPESEQPPRKRLYLSTIGSRYEIGESSTARPARGQGIDYGFVSTVDAEERRQGIEKCWERQIRVVELAELHEWNTQDLYALLEDAQGWMTLPGDRFFVLGEWRRRPMLPARLGSFRLAQLRQTATAARVELSFRTHHQVHETRFHMQLAELAALRETDRRRQDQMVETLRVIRDMRREMSDMQTELLALREQRKAAGQSGPEARISDYQEASGDADSHI
ncbi:hypothetical protein Tco_0200852, partial [Tanacetum coccineum]